MAQVLTIHPDDPQPRLVSRAAEVVRDGGVIAYPTDSGYALGCHLDDKRAVERLRRVRRLDDRHHLTLVCRDLSELSRYAKVDNTAYRLMKRLTPGPYTFILPATHEVPRRLWHPKRKTIGLRVPDNRIAQALLEALGEPLISTTLILPGESLPMTDPWEIEAQVGAQLDLVIDGGYGGLEPTTVVDLTGEVPQVIRAGAGPVDWEE
ncbi:MAG TPA: threonylcarbamoyl-AMP synthase [Chromatiales bacterium]|nr:threonylcarbamoyl-AMP synthase [Chromatiales bacterium]